MLQKNELRYHKDKSDKTPIRALNLDECSECQRDSSHKGKFNVFRYQHFRQIFTSNDRRRNGVCRPFTTSFHYSFRHHLKKSINRCFICYCNRMVFRWRTFFMYATTEKECNDWVSLINWRLVRTEYAYLLMLVFDAV